MTGETVGPYQVLEKIGQGGMGVVYKARDSRLRRLVALKFLTTESSDGSRRFLHEAQTASTLNHPNIITIYDIVEHEGRTFIVMEHVDGEPLRNLIGHSGMEVTAALGVGIQIAQALEAAHQAGVVHRDLKPGNVMIARNGRVKVLDFGLAFFHAQPIGEDTISVVTHRGQFVGTVAYISPEQSTNREVDRRSDIFSFGVMLHEMLTGKRPFVGVSLVDLLCDINRGEPARLRATRPDLPASLEALILKMLEKKPEDRFQTMADVAASLAAVEREIDRKQGFALASGTMEIPAPAARPIGDKISVAVAAFRSLSASEEAKLAAEGITMEIIDALSGVPGIRLASQSVASRLKSETDSVAAAVALNLQFIVSGTVRQSGDRLRVIAELVDSSDGSRVWSKTYTGEGAGPAGSFDNLEAIGKAIAASVSGALLRAGAENALRTPSEVLDASGLVRRARHAFTHAYHSNGINRAIELLRQAIVETPDYATAHAYLGLYLIQRAINGFSEHPEEDSQAALECVEMAVQLTPGDAEVLENAGLVLLHSGKYERSVSTLRRAVQIAQFDLVAWGYLGLALGWGGDEPEMAEAQGIFDHLLRDMPDHPSLPYWLYFKSGVSLRQGKLDEALDLARRAADAQPRFLVAQVNYANALGLAGRNDEAREVIGRVLALSSNVSQAGYVRELKQIARSRDRWLPHIAGLIAAGIFTAE